MEGFRLDSEGEIHTHKLSLFIPLRRGTSNPEPRFWIYGLKNIVQNSNEVYLKFVNDKLLFSDLLSIIKAHHSTN